MSTKERLFDVPQDHLSKRQIRRAEIKALKEKHGIYTNYCEGLGWLALSMPQCINAVKGYGLTEEEKTYAPALMAGYCRLLEEAGLLADGCASEYEAVKQIADRLSK
jgi:hypothetical protein